jgi:hypothetical protein
MSDPLRGRYGVRGSSTGRWTRGYSRDEPFGLWRRDVGGVGSANGSKEGIGIGGMGVIGLIASGWFGLIGRKAWERRKRRENRKLMKYQKEILVEPAFHSSVRTGGAKRRDERRR